MANSSTGLKENKKAAAISPEKSTFKHWNLICIGILLIVTALVFSQFVFTDKMLGSAHSDQLASVGSKQYLSNSISHNGQFPTWESTRLGGMPSIDALFSDALYIPGTIVRALMPAHQAFGYLMVLHIFLAGMFFFLMLNKSFGVTRLAALTGAMFYMLSPQFVTHVYPGHDGKMFVIAWLPFVIWRLRSLLAIPALRNVALLGLGIAAMIFTSHIQMTYFVLWGVFLYWVVNTVLSVRAKEWHQNILLKSLAFWGAVFLGLGISFVQFFPSFMFVREAFSVRGIDRGFEHAASWSLHWAEFFSLWVHEFGNSLQYYWGKNYFKLNTEYAGMIPLLLSVLAIVSKPKSVWRVFWGAIAVFAVLFALGANTPFFSILYHTIPGVKSFRAPSMIMFWFTFATILLSVYFVKDLLSGRFNIIDGKEKQKWTRGLWIAMGGVTFIAILFSIESFAVSFSRSMMGGADAFRTFQVNFSEKFVPALWLWWLFIMVSLGMFLAVINGKIKPAVLVFTLLAIGMADMIKVNGQFIATESPRKYFYHNDPTLGELKSEFDKAPFRVFSVNGTFQTQNQEGAYGLEGVGGFHDNELNIYRSFRGDQRDIHFLESIADISPDGRLSLSMTKIIGNTPFLDLADVGYILLPSNTGGVAKVKNPTSLGRLSYAADYRVMDEDRIIPALRRREYNYRTTVALVEKPQLPFNKNDRRDDRSRPSAMAENNAGDESNVLTDKQSDAVDELQTAIDDFRSAAMVNNNQQLKVEWKKYTPNKRVAAVTMPSDGFLRISEVYYPGWRISIDGTEVKYYRSDMAWMAVPLKAGTYEVLMEPKSLYMDRALKVTLICTLMAVVILMLPLVKRSRGRAVKA
ncbi:MAG: hypothetical protein FWE57_05495 [Chitinispirillia bacterium]|nr:hypothetical protein [Chitinispirillia bacterium]